MIGLKIFDKQGNEIYSCDCVLDPFIHLAPFRGKRQYCAEDARGVVIGKRLYCSFTMVDIPQQPSDEEKLNPKWLKEWARKWLWFTATASISLKDLRERNFRWRYHKNAVLDASLCAEWAENNMRSKNGCLFGSKVSLSGILKAVYLAFVRPMKSKGKSTMYNYTVFYAIADKVTGPYRLLKKAFTSRRPQGEMAGLAFDAAFVGTTGPPVKTEIGYLNIDHGGSYSADNRIYRLGLMIHDKNDPTRTIYRSWLPILIPEKDYELQGLVNNVVYCNGFIPELDKNRIILYYGTADKYTGRAIITLVDNWRELKESDFKAMEAKELDLLKQIRDSFKTIGNQDTFSLQGTKSTSSPVSDYEKVAQFLGTVPSWFWFLSGGVAAGLVLFSLILYVFFPIIWYSWRLKSNNYFVRLNSIEKLEKRGGRQAVRPLEEALDDSDSSIYAAAARSLGKLGDEQVAVPLRRKLTNLTFVPHIVTFIEALVDLKDRDSIATLIGLRSIVDYDVFVAVAKGLKELGASREQYIAFGNNALRSEDPRVFQKAALLLNKYGYAKGGEVLTVKLNHKKSSQRAAVAQGLLYLDDVETLTVEFGDSYEMALQAYKLVAEGKWDEIKDIGQPAFPALGAALRGDKYENKYQKAAVLFEEIADPHNETTFSFLLDELNRADEPDSCIIELLGESGNIRAAEALLNKYPERINRECVADAFSKLGYRCAVDPLLRSLPLVDKEPNKLCSFMTALGKLGDNRASEPIMERLNSRDRRIRTTVACAFLELNDVESLRGRFGEEYELILRGYILVGEGKWDEVVKLGSHAFYGLEACLTEPVFPKAAIDNLIRLGDKRAINSITAVAPSINYAGAKAALLMLGASTEEMKSFYVKALSGSYQRKLAVEDLKKLGAEAKDALGDLRQALSCESKTTTEPVFDNHGAEVSVTVVPNPMYAAIEDAIVAIESSVKFSLKMKKYNVPVNLNVPLIEYALENHRVPLERIADKGLREFLQFLKSRRQRNIVVMGGGVRDIFFDEEVNDLDVTTKVRISKEEREGFRSIASQASARVYKQANKFINKLARVMTVRADDLRSPKPDTMVRFNNLEMQYAGPIELTTALGTRVILKRFFVDVRSKAGFSDATGASLLKMAIDCDGNLYGEVDALEALLSGKVELSGAGVNFGINDILRLLRLKYQFDLVISDIDYELVREILGKYRTGELEISQLILPATERQMARLLQTARDQQSVKNELEELGIIALVDIKTVSSPGGLTVSSPMGQATGYGPQATSFKALSQKPAAGSRFISSPLAIRAGPEVNRSGSTLVNILSLSEISQRFSHEFVIKPSTIDHRLSTGLSAYSERSRSASSPVDKVGLSHKQIAAKVKRIGSPQLKETWEKIEQLRIDVGDIDTCELGGEKINYYRVLKISNYFLRINKFLTPLSLSYMASFFLGWPRISILMIIVAIIVAINGLNSFVFAGHYFTVLLKKKNNIKYRDVANLLKIKNFRRWLDDHKTSKEAIKKLGQVGINQLWDNPGYKKVYHQKGKV